MSEPVEVRILDRDFTVGCEPGERDSLMAAAQFLDARMREVRGSNRIAALDRVAVLTALNLAAELLQARKQRRRPATRICRAHARRNEPQARRIVRLARHPLIASAGAAAGATPTKYSREIFTRSRIRGAILRPYPLPCSTACANIHLVR